MSFYSYSSKHSKHCSPSIATIHNRNLVGLTHRWRGSIYEISSNHLHYFYYWVTASLTGELSLSDYTYWRMLSLLCFMRKISTSSVLYSLYKRQWIHTLHTHCSSLLAFILRFSSLWSSPSWQWVVHLTLNLSSELLASLQLMGSSSSDDASILWHTTLWPNFLARWLRSWQAGTAPTMPGVEISTWTCYNATSNTVRPTITGFLFVDLMCRKGLLFAMAQIGFWLIRRPDFTVDQS